MPAAADSDVRATPRRRLSAEQRTEQLLDIAERLFAERGYAETSIEDIARIAGVTRPIVYARLGGKEGTYLAVVERVRHQLEERFGAAALAHSSPEEQLRAGIDAFFAYLEAEPRRWRILYGSSTPMVGDLGEQLSAARFHTVALIASLLRTHLAEDASTPEIEVMAHLVSGALEQLGRWWVRHPDVARADVVRQATGVLWGGLGARVAAR
ncbi:TetR/AcrR family transcriptional regulator [Nocardioides sp. R-C-SC26]|uniref:TetR/AcrR family transcriptional regulator n=1 Tax=Nocardioides sp. R-C-SC26 TaxID=2870414 RepID=UPI001E2DDD47|nr:TetR/AcrR family transcriptional regulator [Nocardioides sp. R-C-SC26]